MIGWGKGGAKGAYSGISGGEKAADDPERGKERGGEGRIGEEAEMEEGNLLKERLMQG